MGTDGPATGPAAKAPFRTTELDEGQRAAQMGADPDRLIDGEDPETLQVHDADHWIRVYTDLLEFKHRLLITAHEMVPSMERAARREVDQTDMIAIDAESRKFERRLAFWRKRRVELGGDP